MRASIAPGGGQLNPSMTLGAMSSADGRFIAFSSGTADESTGNFDVHVYVHDRQTGQTTIGSKANGSEQSIGGIFPSISSDGRFVAFVTLGAGVPGATRTRISTPSSTIARPVRPRVSVSPVTVPRERRQWVSGAQRRWSLRGVQQ